MRLLTTLLVSAVLSACVPRVPLQGKACDDDHPCGPDLECCDGECLPHCPRCPGRECTLDWAVDCEHGRLCTEGCWEPCPVCEQRCEDESYEMCDSGQEGETWLCRDQEVCVVRVAGAQRSADCHMPPPQCMGDLGATCACLTAPMAITMYPPPCNADEYCAETTTGCIICTLPMAQDAGVGMDAIGNPDGAGVADHGWQDDLGTSAADTGAEDDAGVVVLDGAAADAMSAPDAAAADAGGATDAGALPDIPLSNDAAGPLDGTTAVDSALPDAWRPDTAIPDSGNPDAATLCGPTPPSCFNAVGTGPVGETCCDDDMLQAQCVGTSWRCPGQSDFATRCDGYGSYCMSGTQPLCAASQSCVWAWDGTLGTHCTDFGPPAPCVDGAWQCIAGSAPPSSCDCVTPSCPP